MLSIVEVRDLSAKSGVLLSDGRLVVVNVAPAALTLADVRAAITGTSPVHALVGQVVTSPLPATTLKGAAAYLKNAADEIIQVIDLATVIAERQTVAAADVAEIDVTLGNEHSAVVSNGTVRLLATGQVIAGVDRTGQAPPTPVSFGALI